jgi:SAM-dependent methyltransferase
MRDLTVALRENMIAERIATAAEQLFHYEFRSRSWFERSPVLQESFASASDPGFIRLVDTDGVIYIREITECGVAFPPWQDMLMVSGDTDLRTFLNIGRGCYDVLVPHIVSTGRKRILDFGVGCARTARHFYRLLSSVEMHGCDVDSAPIKFLDQSVPFIAPVVIGNDPPLPYPDDYFDVIYSISVFTHLNEASFHGTHALRIVDQKIEKVDPNSIDLNELHKLDDAFQAKGFIWVSQKTTSADVDRKKYGCTFTDETRLNLYLPEGLHCVSYTVGQIYNWQDVGVFEKR